MTPAHPPDCEYLVVGSGAGGGTAPFRMKCDVHSWMSAYIGVFSHPFFGVSDDQGEVELKNLPAGTFQVQAWQEKYGMQTQSVTVAAGEVKEITFTFKAS